jgi:hypothetical protein
MRTTEGEILKSKITEDLHKVKKIEDKRVILENGNGSVWISLLEKDLGFYYEKMNGGDA